jgi:hypothetical protein
VHLVGFFAAERIAIRVLQKFSTLQ